jgi:WG containing repeat
MTELHLFPIFVRQGRSKAHFKVGYINQSGSVVVDPIYDEGTCFREGLASVRVRSRWGIINTSGEFVVAPKSMGWCRFQDGLSAISVKGTWGIIDRTGNFVLKPKYDYLESFSQGRAVFRVGKFQERQRWRYGYLDKTGSEVTPAVFHNAHGFSEGLAAAKLGDLWGYINPSGVFKITPRFEGTRQGPYRPEETRAGCFANGLAPVWCGKGYGFADTMGNVVVEGRFDEAGSFHDNRALVQLGGCYGFVDLSGRILIEPMFSYASDFSEGLAPVREKKSHSGVLPPCGFVDVDGNMVLQPAFESANGFRNGLSLVTTEDSIGYINRYGEYMWQGPDVDYGVVW